MPRIGLVGTYPGTRVCVLYFKFTFSEKIVTADSRPAVAGNASINTIISSSNATRGVPIPDPTLSVLPVRSRT
eukprot:2703788-Rhodomonas_salina.1